MAMARGSARVKADVVAVAVAVEVAVEVVVAMAVVVVVIVMVVVVAVRLVVVAVKVRVGVAVALVRARAVGGNEDNSGNYNVRRLYNNQLKGPLEGTSLAATSVASAFSVGGTGRSKIYDKKIHCTAARPTHHQTLLLPPSMPPFS
jgi:hypothetical protein